MIQNYLKNDYRNDFIQVLLENNEKKKLERRRYFLENVGLPNNFRSNPSRIIRKDFVLILFDYRTKYSELEIFVKSQNKYPKWYCPHYK